jgi:hypothetical protein
MQGYLIGWYFHLAEFDTALARAKDVVRRRLGLCPRCAAREAQQPDP